MFRTNSLPTLTLMELKKSTFACVRLEHVPSCSIDLLHAPFVSGLERHADI